VLTEISTFVTIVKTVVEIWQKVKPQEEAQGARSIGQTVEAKTLDVSDPRVAVQAVKDVAAKQMEPDTARDFIRDVQTGWVLDTIRHHLRRNEKWTIIDEPAFLLAAEKIDYMGSLETGHHTIGFTSGPWHAREVDQEFDRWARWIKGRSGSQEALLVFVYEGMAGIDQAHIMELKASGGFLSSKKITAGTLDLSRMQLDAPEGWLDVPLGGPNFWEASLEAPLADLHKYYLQISGYFR
jgi:hypothetical protein